MNRTMSSTLSLLIVALLAATVILGVKYQHQSARYAETRQSEEAVRKQFDTALSSIAEIQDSLNAIAPKEMSLTRLSQEAGAGAEVTQSQKDQMLGTISALRTSIEASQQRIHDLEKSLKGSQAKVAGLERVIANLKQTVAEKQATIDLLTARVDSLTTTVIGLRGDVARGEEKIAEQAQTIDEKQKELGAVYYVIGTRDELITRGVVTRTGGVIGFGKTTQVSAAFREADFTPLDTDKQTELAIPGTEPKVLSAQNVASYELRGDKDPRTLVIKNAAEFRKVKYLVIMIKDHLKAGTPAP